MVPNRAPSPSPGAFASSAVTSPKSSTAAAAPMSSPLRSTSGGLHQAAHQDEEAAQSLAMTEYHFIVLQV